MRCDMIVVGPASIYVALLAINHVNCPEVIQTPRAPSHQNCIIGGSSPDVPSKQCYIGNLLMPFAHSRKPCHASRPEQRSQEDQFFEPLVEGLQHLEDGLRWWLSAGVCWAVRCGGAVATCEPSRAGSRHRRPPLPPHSVPPVPPPGGNCRPAQN